MQKNAGNNFRNPCYEHKIFIPSNKSPVMKKNLPSSILISNAIIAGLCCRMASPDPSSPCKTFCTDKEQKKYTDLTGIRSYIVHINKRRNASDGIAEKMPGNKLPGTTISDWIRKKILKDQLCDRIICLSK